MKTTQIETRKGTASRLLGVSTLAWVGIDEFTDLQTIVFSLRDE